MEIFLISPVIPRDFMRDAISIAGRSSGLIPWREEGTSSSAEEPKYFSRTFNPKPKAVLIIFLEGCSLSKSEAGIVVLTFIVGF